MHIIRCLGLTLLFMVPSLLQAEEAAVGTWRLGLGTGAFAVSATPTANNQTYHKILPAYQASISYAMLPGQVQRFFLPNLDVGLLISGGKKAHAHKGVTTVLLEMPTLVQLFGRVSTPVDAEWDVYGMLSLGMFNEKVQDNATTQPRNNRVAALGLGGGFSRKINKHYALDLGVFMPGIVLSKGNKAISQKVIGMLLNLRYSF